MCCASDKIPNSRSCSRVILDTRWNQMQVNTVSLFWKWEPEYSRADSQTGMSSYSPVVIVKKLNFCKGGTFEKCTWINTFSLVAQNPDIPQGKAGSFWFHFSDWGEKAKNSEYWKIILPFGLCPLKPHRILLSSPICLDLITGLELLLKLQATFPDSNAKATGQEEERIFKCNQNS